MGKRVDLIIAGCGGRGFGYAKFAERCPEKARVVGVADPRAYYRESLAAAHSVPGENVFKSWEDMASRGRFADAVIVATQDAGHREPVLAFSSLGYDILLEKPMAPDEKSCVDIVSAVKKAGIIFGVCHVMRYTAYTAALKNMIDSGAVGDVVCLHHREPVGYWHQAHSYVRGNWRSERESSPMLLAKSCHDIDWLRYVMERRIEAVSSFGSLKHFRKEDRPNGAAERCVDCPVENTCPYSAVKIYLRDRLLKGLVHWPVDVLTEHPSEESVMDALKKGPYGRCVYTCDNDVVDNQVVIIEFEGKRTAAFTMTGFSRSGGRETVIQGTRGEIRGDGSVITVYDFLSDSEKVVDTRAADPGILGGHGGGDGRLMEAFVAAVSERDASKILSGPDETLETHLAVFAAEKSRKEGMVVRI